MKKQTLLVIFGGRSTEHEVSCLSVVNVVRSVDLEKYEIVLVGITKDGRWLHADSIESIENGSWRNSSVSAFLLPDAKLQSLLLRDGEGQEKLRKIDVIFPVLHGKNGEDGTIQGLFELTRIPYVGCGVLASAVSMDKLYTKLIANTALLRVDGVRQARFVPVIGKEVEDLDACAERVEEKLKYPVFVKPANAGSSTGVTKAHDREELKKALLTAYKVDRKILVEENIVGREVETAVFRDGEGRIQVSGVGEIKAAADFYDYDAKYNDPKSRTDVHPVIDEHNLELIRTAAKAVFRAVDGYGLARVDFFLTEHGPVFNELNTMPGFTAISMYPMLWEAKGIDKKKLIQDLIDTAFHRPGADFEA